MPVDKEIDTTNEDELYAGAGCSRSWIQLSLCLQSNAVLVECSTQVCRVLDLLCERMMKQSYTNHVLAIKFHYLGALLRQCAKTNDPGLQSWIKG